MAEKAAASEELMATKSFKFLQKAINMVSDDVSSLFSIHIRIICMLGACPLKYLLTMFSLVVEFSHIELSRELLVCRNALPHTERRTFINEGDSINADRVSIKASRSSWILRCKVKRIRDSYELVER